MRKIAITGTELLVSDICLGTAEWGSTIDADQVQKLLETFLFAGGNFLDTAHCYAYWLNDGKGLGRSELMIGQMLERLGMRNQVILATKGGHADGGKDYPRPRQALSRHLVERDLEESLERMNIDYIDLYYLHRDDGITPVCEVMQMLNEFIAQGLVRHIAASNWCIQRLSAANEYARSRNLQGFCCSQLQWSLATPTWCAGGDPTCRKVDPATAQWHAESQMPVIAYSATARGFFASAGRIRDQYDTAENRCRLNRAQQLAAELGCTPNQVAIAWLLRQAFPVIAITGTTQVDHLADTLGAGDIELSSQQIGWLWEATAPSRTA